MNNSLPSTSTNADSSAIRILVVDDHAVVRRGLAHLVSLEPGLEVCAEAQSAREALAAIRELKPDLAIIDLSLHDISGIELIKQVHASWPALPMLVLSMHDELLYAERVLRAGAQGYIMKAEATDKLVVAIRTILSGKISVSDRMSSRILARLAGTSADAQTTPVDSLSDRELEVFELMGQGLGTRLVAQRMCLSIKTVEFHCKNIKVKMGLKTGNELVHVATQWALQEGKQ